MREELRQFTVTDWVYIIAMTIGVVLGLLTIFSYVRGWVYIRRSEPDAPTPMIEMMEETW